MDPTMIIGHTASMLRAQGYEGFYKKKDVTKVVLKPQG